MIVVGTIYMTRVLRTRVCVIVCISLYITEIIAVESEAVNNELSSSTS